MRSREDVLEILEAALRHSRADQTEVVVWNRELQLTRFANSAIHQNLAESNTQVRVRVALGKRLGHAVTNRTEAAEVAQAVDRAIALARLVEPNKEFVSLPAPAPLPEVRAFFAATAASEPESRADVVARVAGIAQKGNCEAAGSLSVSVDVLGVGSSLGIRAYQPVTQAQFTMIVTDSDASGFAQAVSRDLSKLDCSAAAETALRKCLDSRRPANLTPGDYAVVLEPAAMGELILFLAYLGFGATVVQEDRSFLCGRFGTQVMSEQVSIWDDGLDARGLPLAFDFEGMPKRRVDLIERGVARGVVYDSYSAHKEKKTSTGHALPAPNTWGPIPTNLFMATGTSSLREMIEGTERGVLVTRFHYVNPIHEKRTDVTGMTRDGTFLIEAGRIARPLRNLRFTQSIVEALSGVDLLGSEAEVVGECTVPAVKLRRFRFSS